MKTHQSEAIQQLGELEREINHLGSRMQQEQQTRQGLELELRGKNETVTRLQRRLQAVGFRLEALMDLLERGEDGREFLGKLIADTTKLNHPEG